MGYPKGGVRYVRETGMFELKCGSCGDYVELVVENWHPRSGLTRCAACWAEYQRLKQRGYRAAAIDNELGRARQRLRYFANHEANLINRRAWRAANKERVAAYNKAYRERKKAA